MIGKKKESGWTFWTSCSGGVGIKYFVAEGGFIELKDPQKKIHRFYYGAAGGGYSSRIKLPFKIKVPDSLLKNLDKIFGKKVTRAGAPFFFESRGLVYILDTFKGDELSVSDINGACLFIEGGLGRVIGGSAYAMLLGMDPKLAALYLAAASSPATLPIASFIATKMMLTASSILLMAGVNLSYGEGIGVYLGYLGDKLPHLTEPIQKYPLPERVRYPLPPRVPAQPMAHNRLASAGVRNTQNQNRKSARHEDKQHKRPVIPKQQYSEIAPNVFQFNCPHPIFTDQPQLYINLSCKEIEEKEKSYGEN
jgi:hypothetical protein